MTDVKAAAASTAVKIALVTGANGAIGKEIAIGIAKLKDWSVILAVRDKAKGTAAATAVSTATGNSNVSVEVFDQSDKKAVSSWAADFRKRVPKLNVLVNNAALISQKRATTAAGLDVMFATNVMGYYWLMHELHPSLKAAGPDARIVNVASNYAGALDVADPQSLKGKYDSNNVYRTNKQANRMLSWAAADAFAADGVTVNACHPGVVESNLLNGLNFSGFESAAQGAATPVYLATSAAVAKKTGGYYVSSQKKDCQFASGKKAIAALWEYCGKL